MAKRTPKKPMTIRQKVEVNTPVTPKGMRSRTGTADKPCETAKGKKCPTQIVFIDGQAYLRFCTKPKARGMMVPVESPKQANAFAKQYCACVAAKGKKTAACTREDCVDACVTAKGKKKSCAEAVTGTKDAPLGLGRFQRKPVKIRR